MVDKRATANVQQLASRATANRALRPLIPVYRPSLAGREKEYVNQCIDSTWISSKGEFIAKFEQKFAEFIGVEHLTSVCNGTVALHVALKALGIGSGDEVILPTLTYIASVNSVLLAGAAPVLADSVEDTWQLDPAEVRRKITPRTKAVMAVHLYGMSCDMDALTDICREYGLLLIEDCAEAIGTLWNGKHVGTFGDAATFSFFGNKTITTGEGGMVVCKTRPTLDKAYLIKTQGVSPAREYWHEVLGFNYRMTNICAAIGLAQTERIEEILINKRKIARWYREALGDVPAKVNVEKPGVENSFWMNCLVLEDAAHTRPLRKHLADHAVETRPFFIPANLMPYLASSESFPVASSLSERGINLPSYPALSKDDVQFVALAINDYFNALNK